MNTRWPKYIICVLTPIMLVLAIAPTAAQESGAGDARVRIGYFAFDPREFDTFIDGEPASFGPSWEKVGWLAAPVPGFEQVICCSNTPYIGFASGAHSFAFAPKGASVDAAVLGPQEVTFAAGHVYSLVVVGELDDQSLKLLVIDESDVFAEADWGSTFRMVSVHDLKGVPSIEAKVSPGMDVAAMDYGDYLTGWAPAGRVLFVYASTAGSDPTTLFDFSTVPVPAGISDLGAYFGSYPGEPGKDYFFAYNWGYAGPLGIVDGGRVAVGDEIAAQVPDVAQRVQYTLTLDADMVLNIYLNSTGKSTAGYQSGAEFSPTLYLYDGEGNLWFWNDELSLKDASAGDYDVGLEEIALPAGTYVIEVGSGADLNSGPYQLIVKNAVGD